MTTDVGALAVSDSRYQNGQPQQVAGAVGVATKWISVSVGGNDVYFGAVGKACALAVARSTSVPVHYLRATGAPNCDVQLAESRAVMQPAGSSQLDQRLYDLYKALLDKAGTARLVVVGYPRLFPDDPSVGGASLNPLTSSERTQLGIPAEAKTVCRTNGLTLGAYWPGVADVHARALNSFVQDINATALRQVAKLSENGYVGRITFANTWDSAVPHNCTGLTSDVSVNGLRLAGSTSTGLKVSTATFHPTKAGQMRIGKQVERAFKNGLAYLGGTYGLAGIAGQPLSESKNPPLKVAGGTAPLNIFPNLTDAVDGLVPGMGHSRLERRPDVHRRRPAAEYRDVVVSPDYSGQRQSDGERPCHDHRGARPISRHPGAQRHCVERRSHFPHDGL